MAARCDTCQGDHPSEAHYREAFTNPVTREPYPTPKALQSAAIRICRSYDIKGIADPQYIANVIATELAIGDGQGDFVDVDLDPHGDVGPLFAVRAEEGYVPHRADDPPDNGAAEIRYPS